VKAGKTRTLELGPHAYNTAKPQAVVVVLPKKQVTVDYGKPAAGSKMWWTGRGDNYTATMTRQVDLTGRSSASLSLQARYEIEQDYDYAYFEYSTDGGSHWTVLDG